MRFVTGSSLAAVVPLTFAYIGDDGALLGAPGRLSGASRPSPRWPRVSRRRSGTVAHFVSWRILYVGVGCLTLLPAICLFRDGGGRRVVR